MAPQWETNGVSPAPQSAALPLQQCGIQVLGPRASGKAILHTRDGGHHLAGFLLLVISMIRSITCGSG